MTKKQKLLLQVRLDVAQWFQAQGLKTVADKIRMDVASALYRASAKRTPGWNALSI